jgi:hypothetical protein
MTRILFELYNTSNIGTPISLDTQSSVILKTGFNQFYVIDLPNLSVGPKSYFFVGLAASPFNFQGSLSSTRTQFS